ncbi:MAG: hypothetical protein U0S12_10820 [Fimbriimonadales bacterium]
MGKESSKWFRFGPVFGLVAFVVRWSLFSQPVAHNPIAQTEFREAAVRVMPVYWALVTTGLLALLIFGRRREATLSWAVYLALLLLSWVLVQPVFYA